MAGLSDIPCVGNIVDRISDATVEALFRRFRYLFCYKNLVTILNHEIEIIKIDEGRVSSKTDAARADGKIIYDHVLKWQAEVREIQVSATEFSEKYKNRPSWKCVQCLPIPRPFSRFRLGREAVQKAKRVTELSDSGKDLLANDIAYLPPVENVPTPDTVYQIFESRKDVYRKLWEALVTEDSSLILGIYGMPGVGKTRMMEQIWKEAKEKNIFDKVIRADVGSDELNVIKLQNQIASQLGCHLESKDDKKHRASQLKNSLMNGGKTLVILDDVWREIPLDTIGISFGDDGSSSGCKILFTSREEEVCLRNNCKHLAHITTLTVDEAWELFSNTVGTCRIDSLHDESLAKKVCTKCAGLPLLIHAVGKALQFKSHNSWKDALSQLENGKVEKIAGIDPQVYACVKLSIDRLEEDAKSCLFLCSLFPEDADIYIRKLIQLATGSQLVPDGECRICAMVEVLRSSSLLLDSQEDHLIKLHDLVRDVARSMSVIDPIYAFKLVRCGSRLPDYADYGTRKLLHLQLQKNYIYYPDDLVCPDLHNLWLQCNKHIQQFSGGFFSIFANLRSLLIEGMFSSLELQLSLKALGKLRTLILDDCDMTLIDQTNFSFFPENLETLCIWDCDLPVPLDLSNLKHLRKLEIQGWRKTIVQMVPNTISSMRSLEELHIPDGFEIQNDGSNISLDAVSAPILAEISRLTGLKSLQMSFMDSEPFHDTNIFGNLLEFNIFVGDSGMDVRYLLHSSVSIKRSIELYGNQLEGLQILIVRAEQVKLHSTDVNISSIYSSNTEAFTDLRNLCINECNSMEYLAWISENVIQPNHQPRASFSELTILEIEECSRIKYLFSNSLANCFVQLQELRIVGCPELESIIMNEGISDKDDIINFCKLKSLWLERLPKLKSFYREGQYLHSSSALIVEGSVISSVEYQPLFDGMVAFPSLEELHMEDMGDTVSNIWGKYYYNDDNLVFYSFSKLKNLWVYGCNKLETVIPLAMLDRLQNLEYLDVYDCNSLGNVFQHFSVARDLIHLKTMEVDSCEMMREIIGAGGEQEVEIADDDDGIIVFPQLTLLKLFVLPELSSFCCYQSREGNTYKVQFPYLMDFLLNSCGEINLDVVELGREDSTCQLRSLRIDCDKEIQLPYKWLPQLHNLEELRLKHCWPHQLKSLCLQQLKVLSVHYSGCSTLFTFSAFRSLQQLQQLDISNCASLEDIVEDETSGMDKMTITLIQLKSVILRNLPNLKKFIHGSNYECHMPALSKVQVDNCGLSTLFTCSVFRKLQQLEELQVSNCRLLEGVVEDARDNDTSLTNGEIISVIRLSLVGLENLPNLKSFSSTSSYAFIMPKLYKFLLVRCPQVEYFTFLKTSTIELVSVYSKWHQGEKISDLNEYIRQNRRREVA